MEVTTEMYGIQVQGVINISAFKNKLMVEESNFKVSMVQNFKNNGCNSSIVVIFCP